MLTLRAAASLLRECSSLEALTALARTAGCVGEPDGLDVETRAAVGLGEETVEAVVIAGRGALRALVLIARARTPLHELIARVAARLAARTPYGLWLVVAGQHHGGEIAIAAWHGIGQPARRGHPRVAALVADRFAIVDSDADTLRALAGAGAGAGGDDDLTTHARWIDILGREALSRRFFKTLEQLVDGLASSATVGNPDARAEIALLYTSRLLFLAFLEAKGWLDGDQGFLARRFDDCMRDGGNFHGRVLLPLFFGTLNTPPAKRSRIARAFGRVPFLNGGLFTPTAVERRHRGLRFDDAAIGRLFGDLFARYRFTAREERATFHEAAIDPEMLGRTFESLMLSRSRLATGAFYTPHELVDRVAASGLEDALSTRLGEALASRVVQGGQLTDHERRQARGAIEGLTILDPACGSGAFLVHLLDRLASLARQLGDERPLDAIRRETLTRSIFGVDVNPTAVWLCELRLWLAVVIEAPDDSGQRVAPLPNLDRNIRVGDSLLGPGVAQGAETPGALAFRRLRDRYTRATGPKKQALARVLDVEERRLAIAAIDTQLQRVTAARLDLVNARRGRDLFGERNLAGRDALHRAMELRRRSAVLRVARARLLGGGALPFSFLAHFADVAARGGFDLIVGNPPWVRPHRLAPSERERYRRTYRVARVAPWHGGIAAGAGHGFAAQVDVAALFVERSLLLLRPRGTVALLLPAKLWRSLAGGGMRHLLEADAELRRVEDYSNARAAFDASVYPGLLVARSLDPSTGAATPDTCVTAAVVHQGGAPMVWRIAKRDLAIDPSPGAPWTLLPKEVRHSFDLLRANGMTLADSPIGRAHLGVKCGLNDAFLVRSRALDDDEAAIIAADSRSGTIERSLIRPVIRGEDVTPWVVARDDRSILWTHEASGGPLALLPPLAARWFAPWRRGLQSRTDARSHARWWTLFRTEAARSNHPRVVWADLGKSPRAAVLLADDPIVPLNTCYVARCRDDDDAFALAALLNSPVAAAWLNAIAEPARGGYRRFLGWTMSIFPLPADWENARIKLAALGRAGTADPTRVGHRLLLEAALAAYDLRADDLAPLLIWATR